MFYLYKAIVARSQNPSPVKAEPLREVNRVPLTMGRDRLFKTYPVDFNLFGLIQRDEKIMDSGRDLLHC